MPFSPSNRQSLVAAGAAACTSCRGRPPSPVSGAVRSARGAFRARFSVRRAPPAAGLFAPPVTVHHAPLGMPSAERGAPRAGVSHRASVFSYTFRGRTARASSGSLLPACMCSSRAGFCVSKKVEKGAQRGGEKYGGRDLQDQDTEARRRRGFVVGRSLISHRSLGMKIPTHPLSACYLLLRTRRAIIWRCLF